MDSRATTIIQQGKQAFERCSGRNALWQEIAENFYVERADFTAGHADSEDFAGHLFGSFPVMARRELANLFASMLRPRSVPWFSLHTSNEELDDERDARAYLEYMQGVQWRAMYDPASQFVTATKMADHDYAAFGNAVIEVMLNRDRTGLLHRTRHLRDCAWMENVDGVVDSMYVKWTPKASHLVEKYPDKVSADVRKRAEKDKGTEIECCIAAVPERSYIPDSSETRRKRRLPWTLMVVEMESETVLEETPEAWFRFVVPRWQRISGTPYARSPATEIVLPDARTYQAVIRTLREAGEAHVNPPMIGIADMMRSDIQLYPGGFTAVDAEFDGELKNALAPVTTNPGSMPIGFEIAAALKDDVRLGMFLDKIRLPDINSKQMTAYEFQKRLEEHIRAASPLFEPIEDEYSAALCNLDFEILKSVNAFGPDSDIPDILKGQNIEFQFRSPLREAQDQAKAGLFADGMERIVLPMMQVNPAYAAAVKVPPAMLDSLRGLGWEAEWLGTEEEMAQALQQVEERQKMQQGMDALNAGGEAANAVGSGAQQLDKALGNDVAA